jgi:hypothetical protein
MTEENRSNVKQYKVWNTLITIHETVDAFMFTYDSFNPLKWRDIICKAIQTATEAGFVPETIKIFTQGTLNKEKWKDAAQIIKQIEKKRIPSKDMSISICGKYLSKYDLTLSFGFNSSTEEMYFFVESEDMHWLKASPADDKKLNDLLTAFSQSLNSKIVEGTHFPWSAKDESKNHYKTL